jgi:hypothetical protein
VAKTSFLPTWQWLDPTYVTQQLGSAGHSGK